MMCTAQIRMLPLVRKGATAVFALLLLGGVQGTRIGAAEAQAVSASAAAVDTDAESGFRGVSLGKYMVRTYYPVEAQKSLVLFTLHATVKNDDVSQFKRLLENRREKVRDQVIIATRLVALTDFNDPDLTSFRRRILLRLRRTLPELAIEDAYLSNFELTVEAL